MSLSLQCPECKKATRVMDSRGTGEWIRRRRVCQGGHRFTTLESPAEFDSFEYEELARQKKEKRVKRLLEDRKRSREREKVSIDSRDFTGNHGK